MELIERHADPHKINHFFDLVEQTNRKLNLVSRETSREKLLSLAADSLVPLEFRIRLEGTFFDIGPGGGFPSIVLMIARNSLKGTLIERTQKKGEFLKSTVREFGLEAEVVPHNFSDAVTLLPHQHYAFGTMKYVRLDKSILAGVSRILIPGGNFLYYSRFNADRAILPKRTTFRNYHYYLDDPEIVRSLTVFSSGGR